MMSVGGLTPASVDAVAWLRGPTAPESPRYLLSEVSAVRRVNGSYFLVDVGFLTDRKFRALSKRLPDDDDFNSAVGAYFIALALSRRNGSSRIDVRLETSSRFVDDLEAVGLLEPEGFPYEAWSAWAPMAPQQAFAGKVRAQQAERDALGRFTPESSASTAASALEPLVQPVQPSPPVQSFPVLSTEEIEPEKEKPNGVEDIEVPAWLVGPEPDCLDTYYRLTVRFPRGKTKTWLEDMATTYGHPEVSKALAIAMTEDQDVATLLSRTQNILAAAEHERVRLGEIARRRRVAAEEKAMRSMSDEDKAANLAKLREAMEAKGLLPRHVDD